MSTLVKIRLLAVAISGFTLVSEAFPVNGNISFNGDDTAYAGVSGTGAVQGDLSLARSIVFNHSTVSTAPAPNGSFAALGGLTVTMAFFLDINPAQLPAGAVWSVGGFSLTLTSLSTIGTPTANALVLSGLGTLSDGNPADNTLAAWTIAFTSSGGQGNATFSFSSSEGASPVPEVNSGELILFGFGLAAAARFIRSSKQPA